MRRLAPTCALVCVFLLISTFSFAAETQSRTFVPVQDGFVTTGETVAAYAPDRVLVKFTPEGMNQATIQEFADKSAGGNTSWTGLASLDAALNALDVSRISPMHGALKNQAEVRRLGIDRWYRIDVVTGTDIESAVDNLAADPNVEFAVPDLRAFPMATPDDPLHPNNWGHNNTAQLPGFDWGGTYSHTGPPVGTVGFDANAHSAWNGSQAYGSASVVIAIIDSGVDSSHPDLLQVAGYDYGDGDSNPHDDSASPGHGTACAGVAAAIADNALGASGIAGGCSIMPLKVSDSAGSLYFSAITDAIYHAADNGADIISMSFGAATTAYAPTDNAIQYAYDAGVTLFGSTGNANDSTIGYPSVNANVISVGAASPCDGRKRSSSNAGEVNPGVNTDPNGFTCDGERWWGSNYGINSQDSRFAVDVIAPTILPTTDIQGAGGYDPSDYSGFFNGTSCATPYAAGVAALIKSVNPGWGPAQIRAQLTSTAFDIVNVESGAGWDEYSGYGLVDAAAAVGAPVVLPPTADFAGVPTEGCAPLTVNFTDLTTGDATSWTWTFGDGNNSNLQNPTNVYASPGTYDVTLLVSGPEGSDSKTVLNYITVGTAPVVDWASSSPTGPAPLTVSFLDLSTNTTGRTWDFGDGGTDTAQYPAHIYTDPGTYTVTMIATGGCEPDTLTRIDYVTVTSSAPPTAAFSGTPLSGCAPLDVAFTDESTGDVTTWDWDFGDGGSSTDQNPNHIYAASGDYDVRLIATGPGGADTLTSVAYISVTEDVAANFSASVTAGTAPLDVDFTDLSTGSPTEWYWDFGDANTDTVQNPSHTYNDGGTYSVMLIATGVCGPDTLIQTDLIVVDAPPAPVAAFSGTPLSGCAPLEVAFTDESTGDITGWDWDFGDGNTDTVQNPAHVYVAAGLYSVTLTVTGPGGGDALVMTDYIEVEDPVTAAFAPSDTTGMGPLTIDFTDQSTGNPTTWLWDFGDATTDTVQNPSHTYTTVDTFTVTLIVGNGCSEDTLTVVDAIKVKALSGVGDVVPVRYALEQNVPNPFNPMTTIFFELPEATSVRLQVYDISGRLVRSLLNGSLGAGRQDVVWNGKDDSGQQVAAGVYFYHLNAGSYNETRRMVLVK
ncbi:MAG: PKD domain-containing protein [Candidatus Krumholzibacteriota bacterium]